MQDTALTTYLLNQWRVVVQRIEGQLWATDGYVLARVDDDAKLFANRRAFPRLPEEGETLIYYGSGKKVERLKNGLKGKIERKELDLLKLIPAYDRETDQIEVTPLVVKSDENDVRIAVAPGRIVPLIDANVAIFNGASYYQADENSPVVVEEGGELIGVTMPANQNHKDVQLALAAVRKVVAC